jgi:hypothetical protein
MKFEINFGWLEDSKLTVETHDFEIISIFQEFVEFQQTYGWGVEYTVVEDVEFEDEEDTEEEIDGEVADAAAEAADKE